MAMNKLMGVLMGTTALLVVIGAFFRLQHYPNGNLIFSIGITLYLILSIIERSRLKRTILNQQQKINELTQS
jgi:hypothetical protein